MAITLKDVADKAGVSKSTASLALNGSNKVKKETKKKVEKAAQSMDYIPNAIGKALKKKSTKTIGLVIPEINNSFFAELVQIIKNELKQDDFNLLLCTTDYQEEEEKRYINVFQSQQVDGVIFACDNHDNSLIKQFAENVAPVVFINRKCKDGSIPVIESDVKAGIYRATNHLIELGHTKIGFVGSQADEREKGYEKALMENNLEIKKEYFYIISDFRESIKRNNILGDIDFPTGMICFNDEIAFKTILLLKNLGIKVPEEVSICGLDNIKVSDIYNPPLTTINVPKQRMAKNAVRLLIKMINKETPEEDEYYYNYDTELIIRESTVKI